MQDNAHRTELMKAAIEVARRGIAAGQSPFGAVIAEPSGKIIVAEHNRVREQCDATAHAEVTAIRAACRILETTDLSGHVMATTCEPCPMCATAIHWARLDQVIYGAAIDDARKACFNELCVSTESLYREGQSKVIIIPRILREECCALFEEWKNGPNPHPY